jgi:hypothetical protein
MHPRAANIADKHRGHAHVCGNGGENVWHASWEVASDPVGQQALLRRQICAVIEESLQMPVRFCLNHAAKNGEKGELLSQLTQMFRTFCIIGYKQNLKKT